MTDFDNGAVVADGVVEARSVGVEEKECDGEGELQRNRATRINQVSV